MNETITVAIVEDKEAIRQSLAILIDGADGFECRAAYETAEDALSQLPARCVDVATEYQATGINIPFSFGPGVYFTDNLHADFNVGVDIAANENTTSDFHAEPGVGYTLLLPGGGVLDINTSYFTSFARGSGAFTIGVAYSLKRNR